MSDWLKRIVIGRRPGITLIRAVVLALVCMIIFKFILLPARARGISMEPTYRRDTYHVIYLLAYKFDNPRRGDVVAIKMAGTRALLLKRIVGFPGEHIGFQAGRLMINGRRMRESYVKDESDWNMPEVLVGESEYFVVGDNRQIPVEKHFFGRVKKDRIVGRLLF